MPEEVVLRSSVKDLQLYQKETPKKKRKILRTPFFTQHFQWALSLIYGYNVKRSDDVNTKLLNDTLSNAVHNLLISNTSKNASS